MKVAELPEILLLAIQSFITRRPKNLLYLSDNSQNYHLEFEETCELIVKAQEEDNEWRQFLNTTKLLFNLKRKSVYFHLSSKFSLKYLQETRFRSEIQGRIHFLPPSPASLAPVVSPLPQISQLSFHLSTKKKKIVDQFLEFSKTPGNLQTIHRLLVSDYHERHMKVPENEDEMDLISCLGEIPILHFHECSFHSKFHSHKFLKTKSLILTSISEDIFPFSRFPALESIIIGRSCHIHDLSECSSLSHLKTIKINNLGDGDIRAGYDWMLTATTPLEDLRVPSYAFSDLICLSNLISLTIDGEVPFFLPSPATIEEIKAIREDNEDEEEEDKEDQQQGEKLIIPIFPRLKYLKYYLTHYCAKLSVLEVQKLHFPALTHFTILRSTVTETVVLDAPIKYFKFQECLALEKVFIKSKTIEAGRIMKITNLDKKYNLNVPVEIIYRKEDYERHPNVCILHDKNFIPPNWKA